MLKCGGDTDEEFSNTCYFLVRGGGAEGQLRVSAVNSVFFLILQPVGRFLWAVKFVNIFWDGSSLCVFFWAVLEAFRLIYLYSTLFIE